MLLVFSKFCGFLQHGYKNGSPNFVMLSEVFEDLFVFLMVLDESFQSNELVVYFLHNVSFPFLGLPSSYEQILKDGRFGLFISF